MLAENRASFISECQISTLGLSLSVHTSVIPASLPGLSVGPPCSVLAVGSPRQFNVRPT